jgi:hypothetical protein
MEQTKKTADLKAYQKAYRAAHPKKKEETNQYMKGYIKKAEDIECKVCDGHYKSYSAYKHNATQKHLKALIAIKEKEEAEAAKPTGETPVTPPTKRRGGAKPPKKAPKKNGLELLKEYESDSEEELSSSSGEEASEEEMDDTFELVNEPIDPAKVVEFLAEHFKTSVNPNRPAETKTPRTNKNATLWKKVAKMVEGKTWQYVGKHITELVNTAYDKPTSRADTVVMLKLVINHFSPLSEADKVRFNEMNRALKKQHIAKQTEMPKDGVSYAELKEHENDENTTMAMLARLYSGEMPALRIYDFINAYVGKHKELNEIDLKKKIMTRRIYKNQKVDKAGKAKEMEIPLPKALCEFIKKRGISGALLGDTNATAIDALLNRTFPQKTATPRYWRAKYTTEVVPTFDKAKLETTLAQLDHSAQTHAAYYRKNSKDPLMSLLI